MNILGVVVRMSFRISKVLDELDAWYAEVVVENGPRYRQPKEWVHLWIDLWGATFEHLHYTLAHVVGVGLPVYLALRVIL